MPVLQLQSADIAVDMGTSTTRVYVKGRGIVINEPSVIALRESDNRIVVVGNDAEEMVGRSGGGLKLRHPLQEGRVADLEAAQLMVQYFANKALGNLRRKPRLVTAKPIGLGKIDEAMYTQTLESIGLRKQAQIEGVLAAGIGAGLPVHEPQGSVIVNIGAGKTEIALLSMDGVVLSHAVNVAGIRIDRAIAEEVRKEYDVQITARAAERIKMDMTDIRPDACVGRTAIVRGRDSATGMPTTAEVDLSVPAKAVSSVVSEILQSVKWVLERIPPELCQDVLRGGITLCGGTAALPKVSTVFEEEFGIPTHVARDPAECTVIGAGYMADHFDLLSEGMAARDAEGN